MATTFNRKNISNHYVVHIKLTQCCQLQLTKATKKPSINNIKKLGTLISPLQNNNAFNKKKIKEEKA